MTVEQALRWARNLGLDRLDATLLLAHHLRRRREWVLAHPEVIVDDERSESFGADCRRRADGVPLAYLTGTREFMALDLHVTSAVLVPRPETEVLASWAIERLAAMQATTPRPRVVDLGTGSGAIALAIAAACPSANVTATDSSAEAIDVARANADRLGLPVQFRHGNWWDAVARERFDLAVSNPPYVAAGDEHLAALRHEPRPALVAGEDGLSAMREIIAGAPAHLSGWMLLEHGWDQAAAVQHLMRTASFTAIETRLDLAGRPRCTAGRTV